MRYSNRLQWDAKANAISRAIASKRDLLDLTISNPTRAGFSYAEEEILAAVSQPKLLRYEAESAGLLDAREAVAAYYGDISASSILLTSSTSEAYSYVFKLLCDPGDEILVPRPSYPLFEMLASLDSVRASQYRLHYDGHWFIDFDELERKIGPKSKAIVVVSPNNPTGSCLKQSEYLQLAKMCASHGMALVCDEVFADYKFDNERHTLAGRNDCSTFVLSGLSKVCALPQMKLGWIVSSSAAAFERLETIADSYLSPGAPVQYGAARLLGTRDAIQRQIRERCQANLATLRASALETLDVEGGWSAIVRVPQVRTEEEWVLGLIDRGVIVQPGHFFDFDTEAYLVLSLLTPSATFAEGIERLITF